MISEMMASPVVPLLSLRGKGPSIGDLIELLGPLGCTLVVASALLFVLIWVDRR